ncbi:pectate lyase superfamily protein-domain-containing protein [Xylariomycetidae sp. FL2044]|nr:pectate lyase superfamily protein-domain-containing protein [Xylariomycetidae sp. FL2044]
MLDNQGNVFRMAPDQGTLDGPVISQQNLSEIVAHKPGFWSQVNATIPANVSTHEQQSDDTAYWLSDLATHGSMPLAPGGYKYYRNVKDYGAVGDGSTDDTEAINRAASEGRCGKECGSSTTLGALVYFPAGTYLISSPIIQYYYTQFVGNAKQKPTIKGTRNFTGIALIDTDPYIPGGGGSQWYINQNQFYRQIRNFVLDLKDMSPYNYDNGQQYAPTGIHWQVAQATSLQNIYFDMPSGSDSNTNTTAVGIFTENGSGGFVSDLEFHGGSIGCFPGSQQYTARNIQFEDCLTAVSMFWDWGFNWQGVTVRNAWIAFDISQIGGSTGQGIGSLSIIDSTFEDVPLGIRTRSDNDAPNIVLDNLFVRNTDDIVAVSGGETLLNGSAGELYITSWAIGRRYTRSDGSGEYVAGLVSPSSEKPGPLLDDNGHYYVRSRPQYEDMGANNIFVATEHGCSSDGTGDQSAAINTLLSSHVGSMIFFPAGIYQVKGTVFIPVGSVIVGSGWSQIMGTGAYFQDQNHPQVMVRVGNQGDRGKMEITDMLFTVKGSTAGAVLMEWNVHEANQGSVAMWDSHFRVGGAKNTDLGLNNCPKSAGFKTDCIAASLVLHVTKGASGYFENVWAWTADHNSTRSQISIYTGRGILIESRGPTWFYGTGSEHAVLYQYQLSKAQQIYMGHIQTESPYFQPIPNSSQPFQLGLFPQDPVFDDCSEDKCAEAWGTRIVDSTDVYLHSAGSYSFFVNYVEGCVDSENCQQRLFQVLNSNKTWVFNLFTKGFGFTTEISVWLPLAGENDCNLTPVVYVDPEVWTNNDPTVQCIPPCVLVLPPSTLSTATTISFPPLVTSVEVGWITTVIIDGSSTTKFTAITENTTLNIPPLTTSIIDFWNVNVTSPLESSGEAVSHIEPLIPTMSIPLPPIIITNSYPRGLLVTSTETRTFYPPPWPHISTPVPHTPGALSGSSSTAPSQSPDTPALTPTSTSSSSLDPFWIYPGSNPKYPPNPEENDDPDSDECETATSSVCGTQISYATDTRGETTTTITSSICESITGCTITGSSTTTTVSATPTVKPYVIYPRSPNTQSDIVSIKQAINRLQPAPVYQYESHSFVLGTIFIFVNGITDGQAGALRQMPVVSDYPMEMILR